ncbi:MAG: hypothetical protein KAU20_06175 [Nanoarchaeota archaeon]|nr:hypothetical protein [Nanoarchaeota archaeon]
MRILRVFPSITRLTPRDELTRFDVPGLFDPQEEIDEIHISVTFTWDIPRAEYLFKAWKDVYPVVRMGGAALGDPGGEFIPGRYLQLGEVITSRGCPNRCKYCFAQEREGNRIRELFIYEGWRIHDNNLLACSNDHFQKVCEMLGSQEKRGVIAGGLEARRFTEFHSSLLREAKVDRMFFANDRIGDLPHLRNAIRILHKSGFTRHHLACFVLIGFQDDTLQKARKRLQETWDLGFIPQAMYYRGKEKDKRTEKEIALWKDLQRDWSRPAITRNIAEGKSI